MSNHVVMIVVIMGHVIMDVVHVIQCGKEMTAPNVIIASAIHANTTQSVKIVRRHIFAGVVHNGLEKTVNFIIIVQVHHVRIIVHVQIHRIPSYVLVHMDG